MDEKVKMITCAWKLKYAVRNDLTLFSYEDHYLRNNSKMLTIFSKVISQKYLYLVINYSLCSSNCQGIDRCQIRKRKFCLFFLSPVGLFQIQSFRLHSNYETTILSRRFPFSTLFLKKKYFIKLQRKYLCSSQGLKLTVKLGWNRSHDQIFENLIAKM